MKVIFLVSIYLWSLICERLIYFKWGFPSLRLRYLKQWKQYANKGKAKDTYFIKTCLLSEVKISMEKYLSIIKMLIAICPMLGLLGAVVGMIHVLMSWQLQVMEMHEQWLRGYLRQQFQQWQVWL